MRKSLNNVCGLHAFRWAILSAPKRLLSTTTKRRPALITALAMAFVSNASVAAEMVPDTSLDTSHDSLSIAAGAYHWFNLPRHDGDLTYGTDGLPDTYRWELFLDGEHHTSSGDTFGFHSDVRFREHGKLRPFISSKIWTWESYGLAKTSAGTFKAGKVWSRFGLDWDGSFYGNVQYFDGLKLDPDWGVTWEKTWALANNLSVDTNTQFFVAEDQVNGSLVGGDAESADGYRERNTAIVRVVPRWTLDANSNVAVGLSGRAGSVEVNGRGSHHVTGAAADLTYANRGFKVYAEADAINGRTNPVHYVSGGASDSYKDYLAGAEYTFKPEHFVGPTTLRYTFSRGEYDNPGGKQDLRLVGVTSQLAKWLTLYVEYVNWDVKATGMPSVKYEDGFQFILYWNIGKTFNF
jgi:hypothetical protein